LCKYGDIQAWPSWSMWSSHKATSKLQTQITSISWTFSKLWQDTLSEHRLYRYLLEWAEECSRLLLKLARNYWEKCRAVYPTSVQGILQLSLRMQVR
jgi:hypothetical protein